MTQNEKLTQATMARLRATIPPDQELDALDESFAELDRKAEMAALWARIGAMILIVGGSFGLGWWARGFFR